MKLNWQWWPGCAGPLCYDFSRLDDYLAQPAVREQLGVGDRPWQSCNPDVYNDFLVRFTLFSIITPSSHCRHPYLVSLPLSVIVASSITGL